MPAMHHEPPEKDTSPLEALRTTIAEGDADLAAARFRTYEAGDLVCQMVGFLGEAGVKP
jgi:hypothetical protein